MFVLKFITLVFVVGIGIPCYVIDFRHRRNKDYVPGNEWSYYSRLKREGHRDGQFMMRSAYAGIALIAAAIVFLAAHLFTA